MGDFPVLSLIGGENHDQTTPGWWYTYPSEKYEFVSWDDDIPNRWKNKIKAIHVPVTTNQIIYIYIYIYILYNITVYNNHSPRSHEQRPCSKPPTRHCLFLGCSGLPLCQSTTLERKSMMPMYRVMCSHQ